MLLTLGMSLAWGDSSAKAQQRQISYPNDFYYSGFGPYYDGEFRDAARTFRRAGQAAYRGVDGKWIDSICYYTMLGECLYRVGDHADALAQYDTALQIAVSDPAWWSRVTFPDVLQAAANNNVARITWGTSSRNTRISNLPNSMSVTTGNANVQQVLQQGGVAQRPELRQFNVVEVARCTALAVRRRNEILGPIAKYDPFTGQLAQAFQNAPNARGHWSSPFSAIPLAFAMQGAGDYEQAFTLLQGSLQINNQYDHPLSGLALVEMGRMMLAQGKLDEAQALFMEATYTGAAFEQSDIVEEGFRGATTVHLMKRTPGVFGPLDPGAVWARTRGSRQLQVALPTLAAQCALTHGDTRAAVALLNTAEQQMGRSDMGLTAWAARINYGRAHCGFQSGNLAAGTSNLLSAMQFQQRAGLWIFRLSMVDTFVQSGGLSQRVADELYSDLLREPNDQDWLIDPMETLSVMLTPHPGPYERWLAIALARQEADRAVEIADRLKRHRFFSTLPMGGRGMAFRWMIGAPDNVLDRDTIQARQKLLLGYPALVDLSRRSDALLASLTALPPIPEDGSDEQRQQRQLLEEWGETSLALEAAIGDLTLRNEPSRQIFPPLVNLTQIQERMEAGQLLWYFIETPGGAYACLITKGEYTLEPLPNANKIKSQISKLLREFGLLDRNAKISAETLASDEWREPLAELRDIVLGDRPASFWETHTQITIVPDGPLWYLPFELLPIEKDSETPLIEKVSIRYAPTLGTTFVSRTDDRINEPLGVVLGRLSPGDEEERAEGWFETLHEHKPEAIAMRGNLPGSSALVAPLFGRLLVLDDCDIERNVFDWAPVPQATTRGQQATLSQWMAFPWRGPDTVLIPGFHTAAESGARNGDGQEIFLAACGLMASGTRTAVLSRWRMGGDSSFDLMDQFLAERSAHSPAQAWRASVLENRGRDLQVAQEPRLDEGRDPFPAEREHPAFWSGYLLLDDGRAAPAGGVEAAPAVPDPGLPGLRLPGAAAPGAPGDDDK
ncbi:MAG: CHAT domain-containing protein [Pirellulaceae bacterium]